MASSFRQKRERQPVGLTSVRGGAAAERIGEAAGRAEAAIIVAAKEQNAAPAVSNPSPNGHEERELAIRLDGVAKRFDDRPVLKDINLAVREGEFVAIVGRSGCGKSTLLRLVAGLDPISEGSMLRGGKPAEGIDPATRVMFQDARLLPWKSVLDNVRIGIRGVPGKDAELKAREALQLVGLQDRADDWPSVLSGGQRQRVALARALAGEPRLLLFDEPLGALDALTRIEMQQLIERLWEKRRFTALLVTHDVSEAVALADRVVLIEEGRIALDLPVTLARPRERDSGFAYFEKRILDRVLRVDEGSGAPKLGYDI